MSVLFYLATDSRNPTKSPATYFCEYQQTTLKVYIRMQRPELPQHDIEDKENGVGGLHAFHLKTYYKAVVIKIMWYWQRKRKNRSYGRE